MGVAADSQESIPDGGLDQVGIPCADDRSHHPSDDGAQLTGDGLGSVSADHLGQAILRGPMGHAQPPDYSFYLDAGAWQARLV
jgi:hypothetical protein